MKRVWYECVRVSGLSEYDADFGTGSKSCYDMYERELDLENYCPRSKLSGLIVRLVLFHQAFSYSGALRLPSGSIASQCEL